MPTSTTSSNSISRNSSYLEDSDSEVEGAMAAGGQDDDLAV
jgi:hypothetical protein